MLSEEQDGTVVQAQRGYLMSDYEENEPDNILSKLNPQLQTLIWLWDNGLKIVTVQKDQRSEVYVERIPSRRRVRNQTGLSNKTTGTFNNMV